MAGPDALERRIRELIRPLNGQYPRPWMTDLSAPERARVLVVGRNQATGFPESAITMDGYCDALFNRNGRTCRALYDALRADQGKGPSPTRRNVDALVARLRARGVDAILETNVICYSTPMSAGLGDERHSGGKARGTAIFRALLDEIRPEVLIAHGTGTVKDLGRILDLRLPSPTPSAPEPIPEREWRRPGGPVASILILPALSPPAWNRWSRSAPGVLDRLADRVADRLGGDANR